MLLQKLGRKSTLIDIHYEKIHFTSFIIEELIHKNYPVEKLALVIKNEYPNYKDIYGEGHYYFMKVTIYEIMHHAEFSGEPEDALFLYIAYCCKYIIDCVKKKEVTLHNFFFRFAHI